MTSKCASISSAKSRPRRPAPSLARFRARFRLRSIKRFPVGQILRGRMIKLPDQRFLPVRPASALVPWPSASVSSMSASRFAWSLTIPANSTHRFGIVEFRLLRHVRERDVMVDQQDERSCVARAKAEDARATPCAKSALASECGRAPTARPVSCRSSAR